MNTREQYQHFDNFLIKILQILYHMMQPNALWLHILYKSISKMMPNSYERQLKKVSHNISWIIHKVSKVPHLIDCQFKASTLQ